MYFTVNAALLLVSSASFSKSMPTRDLDGSEFANITQRGGGIYCSYPIIYNLSTAPLLMYENPVLITGITVGPDPDGGELTAGYTYSVVKAISGGISAGASENSPDTLAEASASASFGVSVSWNRGTSVSATLYCPDNVICGLTAAARYLHVEGIATMHYCGWIGGIDPNAYPCVLPPSPICNDPDVPAGVPYSFTADYPVKFDNSLVDGQDSIVTDFNACAMGYPDGGLPQCPPASAIQLPPGMTCNLEGCTTATCQAMCTGVPDCSPMCQWSPALGCSWCNCQTYSSNIGR